MPERAEPSTTEVPAWALSAPSGPVPDAPAASVPSAGPPSGPDAVPPTPDPSIDLAPGADPRWTRPALLGLLAVTAVAWLWNLDRNGWGNTFYAAAVQAGTESWKAFFFGSFDAASFITVDKPPVSLWVMALSGRVFGFSSWSMLAPNVLLGVAAVGLLFATVRRAWGASAGLLAAAALAVTPVAALMFRFDNPDAALTLLLVASAWALTRALEDGRWRWLLLAAALLGTAFLTKSLQALLVLPGLALAYLVAAPGGPGRRVVRLVGAGGVLAVSGLWWMVLVDAIPATARPYVGGSTDDSTLSLALGSNGLSRLLGSDGGRRPGGAGGGASGGPGGAGGGPGAGFGGAPGIGRMFNDLFGGEIAWLLPAGLLLLVVGLVLTRRAPRTDARRASLLLWGGWLVVSAGVFSFMGGIVHTYYTVAMAPAVAALAGMLLPALWRNRAVQVARGVLAVTVLVTAGTAFVLLGRAGDWLPWLRWVVVAAAVVAALGLVAGGRRPVGAGGPARARVAGAVAGLALASAVAAPLAWSLQTIGTTHTGSIPTSGPRTTGGGGAFAGRGQDLDRIRRELAARGIQVPPGGLPQGGPPLGARPGSGRQGFPGGGAGGNPGGEEQADVALVALVSADSGRYTWVAAAPSSMTAGPLQLASGHPVMSLGGFSGQDPAVTLDGFKALVAEGKVHYYVADGRGGRGFGGRGPGADDGAGGIAEWVASTFTARTVGGATVYDLTRQAAGTTA